MIELMDLRIQARGLPVYTDLRIQAPPTDWSAQGRGPKHDEEKHAEEMRRMAMQQQPKITREGER